MAGEAVTGGEGAPPSGGGKRSAIVEAVTLLDAAGDIEAVEALLRILQDRARARIGLPRLEVPR
jgi:hypothetical protein